MNNPSTPTSDEARVKYNAFAAGQTMGHYEMIRQIGAGGMGEVYLARDILLDRKVAIKVLPRASVNDELAKRRLIREAQAAAKLDHPNICSIYEVSEEDGIAFIAMQYVDGETLVSVMHRRQLSIVEALDFASQIAKALAEAHSRNIVHRDIKPANIIVNRKDEAKVLDFGLAKFAPDRETINKEAETLSILSQPGMILGTVTYMSPEQVKGKEIDARSDIFSFGVLLYEMISGRVPYDGESMAETISLILTAEPPPLQSWASAVSPGLEILVRKCLERDVARRYQTMSYVARDLEQIHREYKHGYAASILDQATLKLEPIATKNTGRWRGLLSSRQALVFAVIALTVGAAIYLVSLRSATPSQNPVISSANSSAYDYYIRGKVKAASDNREDVEAAIKVLEQAIAIDPNYAEAYATLAQAYNTKAFQFAADSEKKQLNENAEVAVEKALALNPNLAEGHFARGVILWTHAKRFPHEQAIQSFKSALALNPNLDEAHHRLGMVYSHIGLLDEAQQEVAKALEINPNNTMARFRAGGINAYQGKYEEAVAVFKTVPRDISPSLIDRNLADALFHLGRLDDASAVVEEYLKTYPQDEGGNITSVKAMLLAKAGKQHEAEATIQHAIQIGKGFGHFHHTAYNIASAYALLNKPDDAVKWLEAAADDGFPNYTYFEIDPNLNNLRKEARFITFMAKLKEQWKKYKTTV